MFLQSEYPKTQNTIEVNAKMMSPLNPEIKINYDNIKVSQNQETSSEIKKG
jgi:hypothetical protein